MAAKSSKTYSLHGYSGLVEQHKSRETGTTISVYCNDQAGLDATLPWSTLCEEHSFNIAHPTLALARRHAANPLGWCEYCNGQLCPRCHDTKTFCACEAEV